MAAKLMLDLEKTNLAARDFHLVSVGSFRRGRIAPAEILKRERDGDIPEEGFWLEFPHLLAWQAPDKGRFLTPEEQSAAGRLLFEGGYLQPIDENERIIVARKIDT